MAMSSDLIIGFVLGFAVLVISLLALFEVFGSADCDHLATQSGLQIKYAIDAAASDDMPVYQNSDVPSEPEYYKTAPIRLCQKQSTYSYFLQYFGGFPEYMIYHEEFPEYSPVGWSEGYPWNGGYANSFVFWTATRTAYGAFKYLSAVKATGTWNIIQLMRTGYRNLNKKEIEFAADILLDLEKVDKRFADMAVEITDGRAVAHALTETNSEIIHEGLTDSGLITGKYTKAGKLELNKNPMDVTLSVKTFNSKLKKYEMDDVPVYALKDNDGKILRWSIEPEKDMKKLTFVPADTFENYIAELEASGAKKQAEAWKAIYALPGEYDPKDVYDWKDLDEGIRSTQHYLKSGLKARIRHNKYFDYIENLEYRTKGTVISAPSMKAFGDAMAELCEENDNFLENFIKPTISERTKIKNNLFKAVGLTTEEKLTKKQTVNAIRSMYDKLSGQSFVPKDFLYNIRKAGMEIFEEDASLATEAVENNWVDFVSGFKKILGDDDYQDFIDTLGGDDIMIKQWMNDMRKHVPAEAVSGGFDLSRKITFETHVNKEHFYWIFDNYEIDDLAKKELGLMFGFLEQNTDTLPVDIPRYLGKGRVRRLIFNRYEGYLTPSSWTYKGLIAQEITEGCKGNSICVYSHDAEITESPYYLDEHVDDFDVRVWRPVSPMLDTVRYVSSFGAIAYTGGSVKDIKVTKTLAGMSAVDLYFEALNAVPEHPRFYVVSPCFAIAKVWKTIYNGKQTIFVKPEKIKMEEKASNYCYADQELINQYTLVWIGTDVLDIVLTYFSAGSYPLLSKIVSFTDPAELAQVGAEMVLAWPGYPWEDMSYTVMDSESGQIGYNEMLEKLKTDGFDY